MALVAAENLITGLRREVLPNGVNPETIRGRGVRSWRHSGLLGRPVVVAAVVHACLSCPGRIVGGTVRVDLCRFAC